MDKLCVALLRVSVCHWPFGRLEVVVELGSLHEFLPDLRDPVQEPLQQLVRSVVRIEPVVALCESFGLILSLLA
jgi:hypothetical protein